VRKKTVAAGYLATIAEACCSDNKEKRKRVDVGKQKRCCGEVTRERTDELAQEQKPVVEEAGEPMGAADKDAARLVHLTSQTGHVGGAS
jgi:hypothetical protein